MQSTRFLLNHCALVPYLWDAQDRDRHVIVLTFLCGRGQTARRIFARFSGKQVHVCPEFRFPPQYFIVRAAGPSLWTAIVIAIRFGVTSMFCIPLSTLPCCLPRRAFLVRSPLHRALFPGNLCGSCLSSLAIANALQ